MPHMNPCKLYIHPAFTYSVGPSSVVWSELGPAPPFHQWECLKSNDHGLSVSCVKWPFFHVRNNVTYPILRCMLGYTNCQQLYHQCHLMTLGSSGVLTNILAWVCSIMLRGVCLCYIMVHKLTKYHLMCLELNPPFFPLIKGAYNFLYAPTSCEIQSTWSMQDD